MRGDLVKARATRTVTTDLPEVLRTVAELLLVVAAVLERRFTQKETR